MRGEGRARPGARSDSRRGRLILGTPNYLGEASAAFRALYERLVFQSLTYRSEQMCINDHPIPVLLVITGNAPEEMYAEGAFYAEMAARYVSTLGRYVGGTKLLIAGDTLQVEDYGRYRWTMFDPEAKRARRERGVSRIAGARL